jgi:hypothetical protein
MATKARAALQTFHAIQASDLASAFNDALKRMRVGDYSPELTQPDGPSTSGGVQAMQHIRLVPQREGQPTLIVGHANHAQGRAELRTFEHVDAVHRQRFKRPVPLDRAQYDDFLSQAKSFLEVLRLKTALVGPTLDLEEPESRGGAGKVLLAFFVALVVAAVGVGLWRFLGRG